LFLLGRGIELGETLEVEQALCGDSTGIATSAPALSCDLLPAAEIVPPSGGDREVVLVGGVTGSIVRVWSGGQEIGDSSGNAINLVRPLVSGESLQLMRELNDGCRAQTTFVIEVR
jgi:hypothetical protein